MVNERLLFKLFFFNILFTLSSPMASSDGNDRKL